MDNKLRPEVKVAAKSVIRMYPDEIEGKTDKEIDEILQYKCECAYRGMKGHIKSYKTRLASLRVIREAV